MQVDLVTPALYALDGFFMPIVQFCLSLRCRYTIVCVVWHEHVVGISLWFIMRGEMERVVAATSTSGIEFSGHLPRFAVQN